MEMGPTCFADVTVERYATVACERPCHSGCCGEETNDDAHEKGYG